MIRNKIKTDIHKLIYERIKNINNMSPFPIVDTEYVEMLKDKIEMDNINYDEEPVVCCGNCKSLFIIQEDNQHHCVKCRTSGGELETFTSIHNYLHEYGDIWELKESDNEQKASCNKD